MNLLEPFSLVRRIASRVLLWLDPKAECFNVWKAVRLLQALLIPHTNESHSKQRNTSKSS
jgi:hypothetical protein